MISSQQHSFDIALATQFSIEEAILIHHFQHWIRINKMAKRNFKDGRTWSYQTRREIAANFPYFSIDQVRRICDKLVEKGVIIQANYNKSVIDRTAWYAFVDEAAFKVDDESIQKMFTNGNFAKWTGKSAKWTGKSATSIPDTIPDAKPLPSEDIAAEAAPPPQKPERTTYGKWVQLSKEEFDKLRDFCGGTSSLHDIINELNDHISSTGSKYKDYASTIRNWHRRNQKWNLKKYLNKSKSFSDTSSARDSLEPVVLTSNSLADILNGASIG